MTKKEFIKRMNETIKEGDYVEYIGRPNEKFLVSLSSAIGFPFCISLIDGTYFSFNKHGFMFRTDTHPIVKKTTPPKKKVVKEFEVNLYNFDPHLYIQNKDLIKIVNDLNIKKAKLLIEVEE